ncbi:MAG: heavy metal-binding domain-containing protein [Sphingomicrobium sp.]
MKKLLFTVCALGLVAQPVFAGAPQKAFVIVNEDVGVPVFPYDLKDRPYEVVGTVKAGVRKATLFSKDPDQKKIYGELWERAEKLGADAVVNASYGDAHVSAFSWGKANATGTAVKFKAVAPAAGSAAAAATPAPAAQ